jgi:triosephosphate isomerase
MIRAMREVIVAANWKMHTTPAEAGSLAHTIATRTRVPGVTRVICPPFTSLASVGAALADDDQDVAVGAQNLHHELQGAYTGEVSAPMLSGLASWVIVGHSERRRDAGETDALIGRKLQRAVEAGLRPILCVGEQLAEREAGQHEAVVNEQLQGALADLAPATLQAAGLVIAYEPVWAIGTGRTASGRDAAAMASAIRRTLGDLGFEAAGAGVPVLYGGSVTSSSMDEFMAEPSIDGALVGGASLKPDEMAGIVARAGLTASARAGSA